MVNSFLNPELLDEKLQSLAGDQIDAALSHRAAQNGISKLLLVVPDFVPHQPDERSVRVIEREVSLPVTSPSGGTSKAAMRGQSKTGHVLKGIRDEIVLLCRLLRKQVCFCTPATRTAFEYMSVVQQAVEHGGDGRTVA